MTVGTGEVRSTGETITEVRTGGFSDQGQPRSGAQGRILVIDEGQRLGHLLPD